MASANRSTNNTGGLTAQSTITGKQEYITSTGGVLDVDVTVNTPPLPSTIVAGQQAVTATAVALPAAVLTQGVILESLSTNTISIFIGGAGVTTATGVELQAGAALSAAVNNLDVLYVVASTTGATITWLGS